MNNKIVSSEKNIIHLNLPTIEAAVGKIYIDDLIKSDVEGKIVFIRVDMNVALKADGTIQDDLRIRKTLATIQKVIDLGGKVVIATHMGRPKGKWIEELTTKPIANRLSELLGQKVTHAPDCIGEEVTKMKQDLKNGEVLFLENLRFYKEETDNDSTFASKLAEGVDLVVNDAFACCHRAHASIKGITEHVELTAGGLLVKSELLGFEPLKNAQKPLVAIIGGAKISSKITVVENILPFVDQMIIGGAMANTFSLAKGHSMGDSMVEDEMIETAKRIMKNFGDKIIIPSDYLVTDDFANPGTVKEVAEDGVELGWNAVDIGKQTVEQIKTILEKAKTVFVNGPMGAYDKNELFSFGTMMVYKTLGAIDAYTAGGGGETRDALAKSGTSLNHASTAGGAFLETVQGAELPGVFALSDRP